MALRFVATLALFAILLHAAPGQAQTAITSSGLGTTVTPPPGGSGTFQITGGSRPGGGQNLFHSFGLFSVGAGDTALFRNTTPGTATANILGRVTGGAVSSIFGAINTLEYPGANLFLLNPQGFIFGPGARLDVNGSFHAVAGSYIGFPGGLRFSADSATAAPLTVAHPSSFGFLGPPPGSISVLPGTTLSVPDGQTLSLVGRSVNVEGATVSAPSGRLQVAAVASAGEIGLGTPDAPELTVDSFTRLGRIDVSGGAVLDASDTSGLGGGTVVIRGGRLFVDGAQVVSRTIGPTDGAPVGIDLLVAEEASLTNGAMVGTITEGAGRGGDVQVTGGRVWVDGPVTTLGTLTTADGNAGDVQVTVTNLSVTGGAAVSSKSEGFGFGSAGRLTITADKTVTVSGRDEFFTPSRIFTESQFLGSGGPITITTPVLSVSDGGRIDVTNADGGGGSILLDVDRLTISDGGQVNSVALALADGAPVSIAATGTVSITGIGIDGLPSGLFSTSVSGARPGDIGVTAGQLTLAGGALIQSGDIFIPEAGNVTIASSGSVTIAGGSGISSEAGFLDSGRVDVSAVSLTIDNGFIKSSTVDVGQAGPVTVNVGTLTLTQGGQIISSSEILAPGAGGSITVNASSGVSISGSAPGGLPASGIFTGDASSGLFSTTQTTGNAGAITVTAPSLTVGADGKISVATSGSGNAGNITLNVGDLNVAGGGRIDSGTTGDGAGGTITANATSIALTGGTVVSNATAGGAGGNINLNGRQIDLTGGATIAARSTGTGNAGNIAVHASEMLTANGSAITTQATVADGGNIELTAPRLIQLVDSRVTTSVESGFGAGGNIRIDPDFLILSNSQIRADAFGGPGGNVSIVADVFLSQGSVISASSALGVPGTINIQATVSDVSGTVTPLPEELLQAAALLRASCATRLAGGKLSSFVAAGRDGLGADPSDLLPSPLLAERPLDTRRSWGAGQPLEASALDGLRLAPWAAAPGYLCR